MRKEYAGQLTRGRSDISTTATNRRAYTPPEAGPEGSWETEHVRHFLPFDPEASSDISVERITSCGIIVNGSRLLRSREGLLPTKD